MHLNYTAYLLISFLPLMIGYIWYNPKWSIFKSANQTADIRSLAMIKILALLLLSFMIVYGYMNLIIHQMGFYELFFTDIMKGSTEANQITSEFLATYGDKHRHFGHGVFHGAINAVLFALPFIASIAILTNKSKTFILNHFGYWLVTSIVIGGLISEFV